jgi:hypothetical protein
MMYRYSYMEVRLMKMVRLNIQIPVAVKAQLDALRGAGLTASGFIRSLLEQHFSKPQAGRKER